MCLLQGKYGQRRTIKQLSITEINCKDKFKNMSDRQAIKNTAMSDKQYSNNTTIKEKQRMLSV